MNQENNPFLAINRFFIRIRVRYGQRLTVFSIFLLISATSWLLNSLTKNYTTQISIPLTFTNFPNDKVLVKQSVEELTLKVDGYGFSLLEYMLGQENKKINLDISRFSIRGMNNGNSSIGVLLTASVFREVSAQLDQEIKLLEIAPDTLALRFEKVKKKRLKIIPDLKFSLAKQYVLANPVLVFPDSIWVSGPISLVDSLNGIYTQHIEMGGLEQSKEFDLRIKPINTVDFKNISVHIKIDVERSTEGNIKIPIKVNNVPKNAILRTFPAYVNINFVTGLSNFNKVKPELFSAVVDYRSLDPENNKLKVEILNYPAFIRMNNVSPLMVEYLIEK
jgi:hypothetical protein